MNVWLAQYDDYLIVQCAMLYGLEPGLQQRFERHGAYEMFQELKVIFQANARIERYEVSNKFLIRLRRIYFSKSFCPCFGL